MTDLCLVRPYSEVFRKLLVAPLWKDPGTMAGPDLRDTRIGGKAPGRDLCLKFRESRDTTQHRLGSFRIVNARLPCTGAASLNSFGQGYPAADFQAVLESPDVNVLTHQFQGSIG